MFVGQINGIEDLEQAAAGAAMEPAQLSGGVVRGELLFTPLEDCVLSYGRYSGDVSISGTFCDHDVTSASR